METVAVINNVMKHIIKFENEDEYSEIKDILATPNLCMIEDSRSTIITPRRKPEPIALCDIAYWDGSAVKTISKNKYTTDLGTAIGVVVIPEGMLLDGRVRIMGLKPVNAAGNASNSNVNMSWSNLKRDTSLTNYNRVPTTDNAGSTSTGSNNTGYLPSDKFTGAQSVVDSKAKYSKTSNLIPSPYLGDDKTLNLEYCKEISGYNNALSDFNGLSNTEVLVGSGSDYVAANAAWKYKDAANSTVQWYLPAAGELGFLMPRFNEINNAVTGVGGVAVDGSSYFWSSSEYSSDYTYYLGTNQGYVGNLYRTSGGYVRVFGILGGGGGN